MRKLKRYLQFFRIPIIVALSAAFLWFFYVPDANGKSDFKINLLGTVLGVGLSIAIAESFNQIVEYKRRKKTFGLIKLITIPYLKSQAENFLATMKSYENISSHKEALAFLMMVSRFDRIGESLDKSWLQLVYSQDFIDAIDCDIHFNKIAHAVLEVLLFTKQITAQSINAQSLLDVDVSFLSEEQETQFYLTRSNNIRDTVNDNAKKLHKYVSELDSEISAFLASNGSYYTEFKR